MAAEDERLEIAPERAVEVRETRTLFRLAPAADNDLGRSSRQIAIVAADTEEEARQIASMRDAFGRDWRDPRFAVCDALERRRATCSAMRLSVRAGCGRSRKAGGEAAMTWNAHGSRLFFAHDRLALPTPRGSFQIAWEYHERSGELGDGASASRFLSDVIETMILRGQRSRLALSNRAISAYERFRSSLDAGSEKVRSSA
jgi:hypothetical protein